MTEKIKEMIDSMTADEIKQRLAAYMAADPQLAPRLMLLVSPSTVHSPMAARGLSPS